MHGKSATKAMEKSWKKSWNVMEFGFENCVGTLSNVVSQLKTF